MIEKSVLKNRVLRQKNYAAIRRILVGIHLTTLTRDLIVRNLVLIEMNRVESWDFRRIFYQQYKCLLAKKIIL